MLQDLENTGITPVNIQRTNIVQEVIDFHSKKENLAKGANSSLLVKEDWT